jgi:hypothetical protein
MVLQTLDELVVSELRGILGLAARRKGRVVAHAA